MNTKQLRQKILDLAIRGKLAPQDPNDEPASVLLERVRAEKEKLIKEGKIKRDKKDSAIIRSTDKPRYEKLPKGWVLTSLGELFNLQAGKFVQASGITAERYLNLYPCYGGNGLRGYVKSYNHDGEYPLIGRQGALCGNLNYATGKFYATEHAVVVECFAKTNPRWAFYFLDKMNLNQYATATAQPGLSVKTINEVSIFLPPLAEQHRIVSAIESAFAVIDEIERNKTELQSAVATTKQKILSLAIRGKLVKQDPDDEAASVLLERIRSEREKLISEGKLKRGKGDSSIVRSGDNPYYEKLPKGWAVCCLDEMLEYEQPTKYIVESTEYNEIFATPVLTAGKSFIIGYTDEVQGICTNLPVIIFDDFTTDSKFVDFKFKVKSSAMKILRTNHADIKYLFYFMQTIECNNTTHKRYWISDYSHRVIALPPFAEQQRIVTAIEAAFKQLDRIVENLN